MIIQNAKHLLEIIRAGYSIGADGINLIISPAYSIDDEMVSLVMDYKTELLELIKNEIT